MEETMNFQIRNFGPINEANIKIGKINVVGGHNATGKSSASKLLYCFLKASSNKRQDFAYESLSSKISSIISTLNKDRRFIRKAKNMDFLELLDEYEQSKEEYMGTDEYGQNKFIDEDIKELDELLDEIQENSDSFYLSMLNNLLQIEFQNNNYEGKISFAEQYDKNMINLNSLLSHSFDDIESIKPNYYLNIYDVFYIDSFSLFDLNRLPLGFKLRRNNYFNHVDYLRILLRDSEINSPDMIKESNLPHKIVEKKVKGIIDGEIRFDRNKFIFISKNSEPCAIEDTASGIKQIGIVQLLLSNYKLKKNSFLIIDEPEVNLHPEWQIKFAEILVLLAKDLNITIYINTHSPMFIEAMSLYSEYYDLLDSTFIYLTEEYGDGFRFKQIDQKDMGAVYENLSRPYDDLDEVKANILFKK